MHRHPWPPWPMRLRGCRRFQGVGHSAAAVAAHGRPEARVGGADAQWSPLPCARGTGGPRLGVAPTGNGHGESGSLKGGSG